MSPTIFALRLKGLGPNTKLQGLLLVMAIVGGAVLTPVTGWISEPFEMWPLTSHACIALFALFGAVAPFRGYSGESPT